MKKLIISMLALATLSSCDKSNDPQPIHNTDPQAIQLTAKVLSVETVTKAAVTAFNDTEIGIYGVKEGTTAGTYEWTATPYYNNPGGVKISSANAITFTTNVYYPMNNKKVKFHAFYPKVETITAPGAGTAPQVKYTIDGETDILYAEVESGTLDNHITAANLAFSHKLAKLDFKVIAGTGFEAGVKIKTITVKSVNADLILDLGTATVSAATPAQTADFKAYDNAAGTEITATLSEVLGTVMVMPDETYQLELTLDNGTVFNLTNQTAPSAGEAYTVKLTFKGTEVSATSSITDWTSTEKEVEIKK